MLKPYIHTSFFSVQWLLCSSGDFAGANLQTCSLGNVFKMSSNIPFILHTNHHKASFKMLHLSLPSLNLVMFIYLFIFHFISFLRA